MKNWTKKKNIKNKKLVHETINNHIRYLKTKQKLFSVKIWLDVRNKAPSICVVVKRGEQKKI